MEHFKIIQVKRLLWNIQSGRLVNSGAEGNSGKAAVV